MERLRKTIKPYLPLAILDARHRVRDIKGYLDVRRDYADKSSRWDLLTSMRTYFRPGKMVLFYPERPAPNKVEYKLCAMLGYAITTNPKHEFDVAFKYMDTTFFDPAVLQGLSVARDRIINVGSIDISKKAVSDAFAKVFGYDLDVDPARYNGKMVEKSNRNCTHDGRVLQGPLAPGDIRDGSVYQKAIDNSLDRGAFVLDCRVPIHGGQIPLVYFKYRAVESRFSNSNSFVELKEPDAVLSAVEQDKLLLFARKIGVDCGEFDVLREKDGRIYVVDVNNTPAGPPNGLPVPECRRALARMRISFDQMLEKYR